MRELSVEDCITKAIVFRAIVQFFSEIAPRVKYKYDSEYSVDNFYEVLKPVFAEANSSWFNSSGITQKSLHKRLSTAMQKQFTV